MSLLTLEPFLCSVNTDRLPQKDQRMITSAWAFKQLCESESDASSAWQQAEDKTWIDILAVYPELARCVAGNKTIPEFIIEQLASSENVDVRWSIACKRRLSEGVMSRLAQDADATVRHRIACNPKVTPQILELLSVDPDKMVAASAKRRLQSR